MTNMADKARVAIIGATGYGGAELLRTLLFHPRVEVARAVAIDHVGRKVGEVHPSLHGITPLVIEQVSPAEAAQGMDAVFFALPHKVTAAEVAHVAPTGVRILDLSGDFRLRDMDAYATYYGPGHPCPELQPTFVYGLPELHREAIRGATRIASPGCFATTIALGLLPAARRGWLAGPSRTVAMTGSSGSGAAAKAGTHHPERAGNLKTYKPLDHQHTPEIEQTLRDAGAQEGFSLQFVPVSAPLVRGILATSFVEVPAEVTEGDVGSAFDEAFAGEPFVRVLHDRYPEVVAIKGSMYVEVGYRLDPVDRHTGTRTLLCVSAVDNLVKGGAGQAVQSFNLMMGWDETLGLAAPPLWP
jgi:N-acetyl-gamma-glutamyl-phosphate reductase